MLLSITLITSSQIAKRHFKYIYSYSALIFLGSSYKFVRDIFWYTFTLLVTLAQTICSANSQTSAEAGQPTPQEFLSLLYDPVIMYLTYMYIHTYIYVPIYAHSLRKRRQRDKDKGNERPSIHR